MRSTILLQKYELEKIVQSVRDFKNIQYPIRLIQEGDNGIGTILQMEFSTELDGIKGEFRTTITSEADW